jgi:hypothetical protein
MNLDRDLKRALRRERPAPGLAERVLARVEHERVAARPSWPRTWRAVAASFLLTAVVGGFAAHEAAQRRRAEGEKAAEQVLVAMRIAGEKVRHAQHAVTGQ